jgi:hypothetical protein
METNKQFYWSWGWKDDTSNQNRYGLVRSSAKKWGTSELSVGSLQATEQNIIPEQWDIRQLSNIDDISTPPDQDWISVTRSKQKLNNKQQTTTQVKTKPSKSLSKQMDVYNNNTFHQIFGHINETYLHATTKHYNIKLTGTLKPCLYCALANITTHPISK